MNKVNNELMAHIKRWENSKYTDKAHWDGKTSIAIGYGFDLLEHIHTNGPNPFSSINQYFKEIKLPLLTSSQMAILKGLLKNKPTDGKLLQDAADKLNIKIKPDQAHNLLKRVIEKEILPDFENALNFNFSTTDKIDSKALSQGIKNALIDLAYTGGLGFIKNSIRLRTAIKNAQKNPGKAHEFWVDAYVEYRYFSNKERGNKKIADGIQNRRDDASDMFKDYLTDGLNCVEMREVIKRLESHEQRINNQNDAHLDPKYQVDFNKLIADLEKHKASLPDCSGGKGGKAGDKANDGNGGVGNVLQDPFVLDLDGDGIELGTLADSQAYFDLNGDGFATRTSWLKGDDGFLALDRNQDGKINDITELFGSPDRTGYEELSELDSNADGVIDKADERFAELLVWQDVNEDGISQADELKSLTEAGIVSISLTHESVTDQQGDGQLARRGSFTWKDGTQGTAGETPGIAADVLFAQHPTFTKYTGTVTIDPTVTTVANIKGYGQIPDLHTYI